MKTSANLLTAFDKTVRLARHLSPDEKIALMKMLSAWLGGPRFFTDGDVVEIVQQAIAANEAQRRSSPILTPDQIRGVR